MLDSDSRAVRALPSFREASFRLALALAFALGLSFGVETRDIRALRHDLEKASNGKSAIDSRNSGLNKSNLEIPSSCRNKLD